MNTDRYNELCDELFQTLLNLQHYYVGMCNDLANNRYSLESAQRDIETLSTSEECGDVLAILADIVALSVGEETEARDAVPATSADRLTA